MAAIIWFCVCASLALVQGDDTDYVLPEITVQALRPRGVRISIPGDPMNRITLFHVELNVYDIKNQYRAGLRKFVTQEHDGRWTYENRTTEIGLGYTVVYYVFVGLGRGKIDFSVINSSIYLSYKSDGYSTQQRGFNFKVTALEDPDEPNYKDLNCPKTATRVIGREVCAGQIIFEDNFDTLEEDKWKIHHYIPLDHPEHPFVSYQRLPEDPTVYVKDGLLYIHPKLQQTLPGFTNETMLTSRLDLIEGCTHKSCISPEPPVDIIPPVVSGRLTSRLAFMYGIVAIRAKLPIGDWLYPEILLESLTKKYGQFNYASGILKIANALGNRRLNLEDYENKVLRGGPIINHNCMTNLIRRKALVNEMWGDSFHVYMLKWTPTNIQLFVDGALWVNLKPGADGLRTWIPRLCRGDWYTHLEGGGKMAPFDHYFNLTLSVAAGGYTEFPDNLVSDGNPKPWTNWGRKSHYDFWKALPSWLPTWEQPSLIIDYVKITAL